MDRAFKQAGFVFKAGRGYARTKDLTKSGLHTSQIKELKDAGYIHRIKRGLYYYPKYDSKGHQELVEVSKIIPQGVICLLSALSYHELTTNRPRENYVAIHRDARKVALPGYPPIRVFYFSDLQYKLGIVEEDLSGHKVKIYDQEKTLCDLVRYRKRIGQDIVKEGFQEYFSQPKVQIEKLLDYAEKTRVRTIVARYLEILP